jgi:hypothetical protein
VPPTVALDPRFRGGDGCHIVFVHTIFGRTLSLNSPASNERQALSHTWAA